MWIFPSLRKLKTCVFEMSMYRVSPDLVHNGMMDNKFLSWNSLSTGLKFMFGVLSVFLNQVDRPL